MLETFIICVIAYSVQVCLSSSHLSPKRIQDMSVTNFQSNHFRTRRGMQWLGKYCIAMMTKVWPMVLPKSSEWVPECSHPFIPWKWVKWVMTPHLRVWLSVLRSQGFLFCAWSELVTVISRHNSVYSIESQHSWDQCSTCVCETYSCVFTCLPGNNMKKCSWSV